MRGLDVIRKKQLFGLSVVFARGCCIIASGENMFLPLVQRVTRLKSSISDIRDLQNCTRSAPAVYPIFLTIPPLIPALPL